MEKIIVSLVADAYLDDDGNYSALATLSKNNVANTDDGSEGYPVDYAKVRWNTLPGWDGGDGTGACEWDKPEGIRFNGQWIADGLDGCNDFKGYVFELEF